MDRGTSRAVLREGYFEEDVEAKAENKGERRSIRFLRMGEKIYDLYTWDKVLQEEGDGGKVVVCKAKGEDTSRTDEYVMKIRSKTSLASGDIEQQFRSCHMKLLSLPAHPGIMPLREVLEDSKFYYVVMQKASVGHLFASLAMDFSDGCMPEGAVQQVMRDIFEAVAHLHKHGIVHRDIKPDNLVVHEVVGSDGSRRRRAALIDFDHAHSEWIPGSEAKRDVNTFGTKRFNAPEAFSCYYSEKTDVYSVGILLYLLMAGRFPFDDEIFSPRASSDASWSAIARRMQATSVDFDCGPWRDQPLCKDLCRRLLAPDPQKRIASAEEALQHPWFRSHGGL